jgi:peptidoglycan hydrolase-like protein with peptidoglycan-binding domain
MLIKLLNPAPGRPVTSPFGWRVHPISGRRRMHNGTDYGGTFTVLAAQDGIVVRKGANMSTINGFGHSLTIDHGSGIRTLYAHGREASRFSVGDRVKAGDVIYTSGSTGASTGAHLHWEVHLNGTPVDPAPYLNFNGNSELVVNGRMNRETWRAFQVVLKKDWGYAGVVDGIAGPQTWRAIQESGRAYGYAGPFDGRENVETRKAVQRRIGATPSGRWDVITVSALQRTLNAGQYTKGVKPVDEPMLPITGKLDKATCKAWQLILKRDWGYTGVIDGILGPNSNRAIQRSAQPFGYKGPVDGVLGTESRKAVQRRLKVKDDGVWGTQTHTALQRALNAGSY